MKDIDDNKVIIELKDKVFVLTIGDFSDKSINVEELLQVQYSAIIGDIITFPVIFNRICNIKAEVDSLVKEIILDNKIFEAHLYSEKKKKLSADGSKVTEAMIDSAIIQDPNYKIKKKYLITVERQAAIIDGLYWSCKSKGKMLEAISAKLRPEEFEKDILEETINDVMIKVHQNYFANKR